MTWSDELKNLTRRICVEKSFSIGNPDGVCFKHFDDEYGFVSFENAFANQWVMIVRETNENIEFETIEDLISADWAID